MFGGGFVVLRGTTREAASAGRLFLFDGRPAARFAASGVTTL
jgi:hypothetical protein